MVSLKKYTKEQIITEGGNRFKKIARMLDREDIEDMLSQALSWLDQAIFTPRAVLFKPEDVMSYKGGWFVDVSALKIDVVNNAYYQDTFDEQLNTILPEVGLMPFIVGGNTFNSLSSISDYLILRSNLNKMNRGLQLDGDYELWPIDEQGRQLLQVRNNHLMRLEFLPNIDRDAEEWYLYDFEYSSLKDILFDMCNLFNYEQVMSAQPLGVGKETQNLANYWQEKLDKDKEEFHNKALVTALF